MPQIFQLFTNLLPIIFMGLISFITITGCSDDQKTEQAQDEAVAISGCQGCHEYRIDDNHSFSCSQCHQGVDGKNTPTESHLGLIAHPAHPDNAEIICGPCHMDKIDLVKQSSHYTLENHIDKIRKAFGGLSPSPPLQKISSSAYPESNLQLVDDLLKRRCLRCHVYTKGDNFPLTSRATGCGSCHLEYYNSKMQSHVFIKKPQDLRCLSCHYGNHVGSDYYGRFEHDFNEEYRTPYTTSENFFRPYGVEFHQLEPDVHQKAGMVCIDCHDRMQVMGAQVTDISCSSCHDVSKLRNLKRRPISQNNNEYTFTSPVTGITLPLPIMINPAHKRYSDKVSCQSCHAQWAYNDAKTHLLRIDHDDFDEFERLSLDGSSETGKILLSHINYEGDMLDPTMTDKVSNDKLPGIWLKGFTERRWDNLQFKRDLNGVLNITRPVLDLQLSWIDSDETVRFNNITPLPGTKTSLPYAPHTIGAAGPFYEERIKKALEQSAYGQPD